jgi:outer membrane protein assembly factor BamE (lipoprotein component of BamABCDE complex)
MKKAFLILLVIMAVIGASFFFYRSTTVGNRRNQIFCEQLNIGMCKDEVLHVLERFGSIHYSTADFGSGNFEIYMGYVDPRIVGQKTYILSFNNSKYSGVSVPASFWEGKGIGSVNAVCDP